MSGSSTFATSKIHTLSIDLWNSDTVCQMKRCSCIQKEKTERYSVSPKFVKIIKVSVTAMFDHRECGSEYNKKHKVVTKTKIWMDPQIEKFK